MPPPIKRTQHNDKLTKNTSKSSRNNSSKFRNNKSKMPWSEIEGASNYHNSHNKRRRRKKDKERSRKDESPLAKFMKESRNSKDRDKAMYHGSTNPYESYIPEEPVMFKSKQQHNDNYNFSQFQDLESDNGDDYSNSIPAKSPIRTVRNRVSKSRKSSNTNRSFINLDEKELNRVSQRWSPIQVQEVPNYELSETPLHPIEMNSLNRESPLQQGI